MPKIRHLHKLVDELANGKVPASVTISGEFA
jgi:hypothetical protein